MAPIPEEIKVSEKAGSGEEELGIKSKDEEVLQGKGPDGVQNDVPETRTYKTRFWVLIVYSILSFLYLWQWNTWGPISETALKVFPNWDASTVALMANLSTIAFTFFIAPVCWFTHRYGLRASVLICSLLLAIGAVLRCFYINNTVFTIMSCVGAFLIGIPGTLVLAGPSELAATWFPPQERTTATAFAQVVCILGGVASYLEPLSVRSPRHDVTNEELLDDIMRLMYISAGANVTLFLMVVTYFPAKPKIPPSISSSMDHPDFIPSVKRFLRSRSAWIMMVSFGMNSGVSYIWFSVMDIVLLPLGVDMIDAMWLGVTAIVSSGVAALTVGRLTDKLTGHMKLSLLGLLVCSMAFYYWLYLLTVNAIIVTKWQVYASVIFAVSFSYSVLPIYFELTVEVLYPCPDVVCCAFLSSAENLVGIVFLLIFFIKDIGYSWVIYSLLGCNLLAILPLVLLKETYSRSDVDRRTGK